jgi:hypothetical protein
METRRERRNGGFGSPTAWSRGRFARHRKLVMSEHSGRWEPATFAGVALDSCRHVCAFFQSRDEEHRLLDPFALDGLTRGEKLSYIVDPARRVEWAAHFRRQGLDLSALLDDGGLELRTWSETHLRGGHFDPDAMLQQSLEQMERSPHRRIRMISDMGWAVDQQRDGELIRYEARANALIERFQHVVICVYDATKFSGDVMLGVLRTHPLVLIGGILHVNPYFVPPAQFLEELDRRKPYSDVD